MVVMVMQQQAQFRQCQFRLSTNRQQGNTKRQQSIGGKKVTINQWHKGTTNWQKKYQSVGNKKVMINHY